VEAILPDRTHAESSPSPQESRRHPGALRPHPDAERLPELGRADYRPFVADIAERGLTTPLEITDKDVVVDGHQRLRAALELGLEDVPVRIVAPADELEYMIKSALRRRNLSQAQKAALALEYSDYAEHRRQAMERRQQNLPGRAATLPLQGKTRERIADLANVSPRMMQDLITIRDADLHLFEQVKAGEKTAHVEAGEIRRERKLAKLGAPPARHAVGRHGDIGRAAAG
jgi:ParB-like chromosome segregation protein Spo0J